MKNRKAAFCSILVAIFVSCSDTSSLEPWKESELQEQGIIDLSELGVMTHDISGGAYINSRKVPDSILGRYSYNLNKSYVNVLRLDSETISSLPYELAAKLINASPEDIRKFAHRYEIDIDVLREASVGKGFNKQSLYQVLRKSPKLNLLQADMSTGMSDVRATQFLKAISEPKGDKK